MAGDGPGALGVAPRGRVVVHVVPELMAQGGSVGVIMVIRARLVGEGRVEGHAFVDVGVAVPDAGALEAVDRVGILPARGRIGKRVAVVEECDAIYSVTDHAVASERLVRRHDGNARHAVEHVLVGRKIRKTLGVRGIEIPRTHHMVTEARGAQINPIPRVRNLHYAGIARGRLRALAPRPRGHGSAGRPCRVGFVKARVVDGRRGEPRGEAGIIGGGRGRRSEYGEDTEDRREWNFHRGWNGPKG